MKQWDKIKPMIEYVIKGNPINRTDLRDLLVTHGIFKNPKPAERMITKWIKNGNLCVWNDNERKYLVALVPKPEVEK